MKLVLALSLSSVAMLSGVAAAAAPDPGAGLGHRDPEVRSARADRRATAVREGTGNAARSAQQRWLVRMQLSRRRVLAASLDNRPHPVRAWATPSSAELLVEVGEKLFLVDTRQGRLFQMADAVRDQLDREFQLLFGYPVPRVEDPRERPPDPVEIVDPQVEAGPALLPTETAMGRALRRSDGGVPLMPNLGLDEYREALRVTFRDGERQVVVYLDPPTGGAPR